MTGLGVECSASHHNMTSSGSVHPQIPSPPARAAHGTVQDLVCTAVTATLALVRSEASGGTAKSSASVAADRPPSGNGYSIRSHSGGSQTLDGMRHLVTDGSPGVPCHYAAGASRACVIWLAALVAAGHQLCSDCRAGALSEALCELTVAAVVSFTGGAAATAAGEPAWWSSKSPSAAAAYRVTLLAHAVCLGALATKAQGGGSVNGGDRGGDWEMGDGEDSLDDTGEESKPARLWRCALQVRRE